MSAKYWCITLCVLINLCNFYTWVVCEHLNFVLPSVKSIGLSGTLLQPGYLFISIYERSLGPRPKTNPSADRFQYRTRGRKGLVDIVHIPKDSLPLIQTCWNYQNFTRGQEAVSDKCHSRLVCHFAAVLSAIRAIVGIWILHHGWMLESASFSKC